ncbi:MAG: hypothetical protein HQ492_00035 [Woeseiaceae bacterium]|nr:hypothetical protein [Woeseiaceae bacterium]
MFPEQYSHPMVGKRVKLENGEIKTVTRVMQTRFGEMAEMDGVADLGYLVGGLTEVTDEPIRVHSYEIAFDVKLTAVVRVTLGAESQDAAISRARDALESALDCMDLSEHAIGGMNDVFDDMKITEASLSQGDQRVFEVIRDGVTVVFDDDHPGHDHCPDCLEDCSDSEYEVDNHRYRYECDRCGKTWEAAFALENIS